MHPVLALAIFPHLMLQNAVTAGCTCPAPAAVEGLTEASYDFEVIARGTGDLCDGNIYREGEKPWLTQVEVLVVRKGETPEQSKTFIRHDHAPSACGVHFTAGRRYLVAGTKDARGFYVTDACSVVPLTDSE